MKILKLTLLILFFLNRINAQQSIHSGGNNAKSSTNSISYSIGQINYTTNATSDGKCYEGVQQPFEFLIKDPITPNGMRDLIIANYISPNGDGDNDVWKVKWPHYIRDYSITITDINGNIIYSKDKEYNNDWDATQGGTPVPDGVYYYTMTKGSEVMYRGSITILK
jgi:gliding motility-associated-like protein